MVRGVIVQITDAAPFYSCSRIAIPVHKDCGEGRTLSNINLLTFRRPASRTWMAIFYRMAASGKQRARYATQEVLEIILQRGLGN